MRLLVGPGRFHFDGRPAGFDYTLRPASAQAPSPLAAPALCMFAQSFYGAPSQLHQPRGLRRLRR